MYNCLLFRISESLQATYDFWLLTMTMTHIFWLFEHLVRLRSTPHWPTRTGGRCAVHDQRCPPVENLTQDSLVWDGLGVVCFSVGSYTMNSWATVTALFKWWNIISYFHEDAKGKLWVWCRASCVRHNIFLTGPHRHLYFRFRVQALFAGEFRSIRGRGCSKSFHFDRPQSCH